jgi:inhibitor of cysteine peptidase
MFYEARSVRTRFCLLVVLLTFSGSIMIMGQQASPSPHAATPPGAVLTERDSGTDVDLSPNSSLTVKLPSNPSTGYAWTVVGDPSPLKLQKTSFRKGASKSGSMGASGPAVFQLSATSAGMATLTLVYRRSWEYNLPPMKTFTVRVNVR